MNWPFYKISLNKYKFAVTYCLALNRKVLVSCHCIFNLYAYRNVERNKGKWIPCWKMKTFIICQEEERQ